MEYHVRSVESASRRVSSDVAVSKRVDGNVNMRILENTLENGSKNKWETAFHTNGALWRSRRAARVRVSSPVRSLCCSTFDRVGRQKTPREASRARARLGRRQRRSRAGVSTRRWVDLRRRRPRSAPIRRIWRDGFRRSACAEWTDTREYRGGRGGVARDARGEGSDRQTGCARHVSVLAHAGRYVRFPTPRPQRWALRRFVCASAASGDERQGSVARVFQKVFLRFVDLGDPSRRKVSRPLTTPRALFFFTT